MSSGILLGSKPTRIALSGKMGAGKTTIAEILEVEQGYFRLSFAQALRNVCHLIFPWVDISDKTQSRQILQKIGEACRSIDPEVWIKHMLMAVINMQQQFEDVHIVVDDCRYRNEFEALKNAGFKMVYLVVDKDTQENRLVAKYGAAWDEDTTNHISELEMEDIPRDMWDMVIDAKQLPEDIVREILYG